MRMDRYISVSIEVKEGDRIVDGEPSNVLCISGTGFLLSIFFDSQAALDMFKGGVDSVRLEEEVGG